MPTLRWRSRTLTYTNRTISGPTCGQMFVWVVRCLTRSAVLDSGPSPLREGDPMRLISLSRRVGLGLASGVCIAALVACGGGDVSAEAVGLGTIEPGVITVAVQPYAPYTSLKADKLT